MRYETGACRFITHKGCRRRLSTSSLDFLNIFLNLSSPGQIGLIFLNFGVVYPKGPWGSALINQHSGVKGAENANQGKFEASGNNTLNHSLLKVYL